MTINPGQADLCRTCKERNDPPTKHNCCRIHCGALGPARQCGKRLPDEAGSRCECIEVRR